MPVSLLGWGPYVEDPGLLGDPGVAQQKLLQNGGKCMAYHPFTDAYSVLPFPGHLYLESSLYADRDVSHLGQDEVCITWLLLRGPRIFQQCAYLCFALLPSPLVFSPLHFLFSFFFPSQY